MLIEPGEWIQSLCSCRTVTLNTVLSISEWSYVYLPFSMLQMVLSVNIPISFIILVMTSTAWHNFELFKKDSLTLLRQVVIMPFFLPSIFMKMGILITALFYIGDVSYNSTKSPYLTSCSIVALLVIVLFYQVLMHLFLGFDMRDDSVVISIFANLTSNARPKISEDEGPVISFFKIETLSSALVYMFISACTTTYIVLYDDKNLYLVFIGFGFILLHLISTQLYLRTSAGQRLLFPEAEETNPTDQRLDSDGAEETQSREELFYTKWIILAISIAATVGLFCYIGIMLTQGKGQILVSCFASA